MIATIRSMRKLSKAERMQADSLPEIRGALNRIALLDGKGKVGNRSASEGHVINAAIIALMALPPDRRKATLSRCYEIMNALMGMEDEPSYEELEAIVAEAWGARAGGGVTPLIEEEIRVPRAKRKGTA